MRRFMLFGVFFLTGCSTAPITGLMDCFSPSKTGSNPDYPPRPTERDPFPDRLPPPQIPSPDVPTRKTPVGEPSARMSPATDATRKPAVEPSDTRILPP